MFPKGTKRKFLDSAEDAATATLAGEQSRTPSPSYSLQRQSLLDMSLIKLQLCHMLVEPNLCRSVLIANTVRQIQEEMTQDGTWQIMTQALAAAQCPTDRLVATEVLCRQSDPAAGQSPKPYPLVGGLDRGYHSEEVVMEAGDAHKEAPPTQSYLAAPFGMSPCWEEEQQQQQQQEEEDDEEDGGGEEDEDGEESEAEDADERPEVDSRPGEQVFGTFEIKQQPPPPPDPALEELFSDVDPSYYELDTVLTGMQSAPKMGPYDLLESLSSHGPQPLSPGASCRSDLNELDHIMEIIVGS
ncbi:cell division cycle-associated protein 4 [Hippocampus zosterae]|uniref:cell division cycle-associated protein 4 n=1 Tax=Hippocampus zosterae TaxID=109293 RepID=UPI00223D7415|nr:cell division cycle-associated protein 4 [Hippocampus zosterae]XP_051942904.1 cell division cycle-associated protein 4 [Hippocampus zosterae]